MKEIQMIQKITSLKVENIKATLNQARENNKKIQVSDLSGEDLSNLDFTGMDLSGSDFRNSNLQNVFFIRSNLDKCDFTGANLHGADFTGANLSNIITEPQWIIQGQVRSDGRAFFLQRLTGDDCPMIKSGPIYFSALSAIAWYSAVEGSRGNREETLIIIQSLIDTMKALGLK